MEITIHTRKNLIKIYINKREKKHASNFAKYASIALKRMKKKKVHN